MREGWEVKTLKEVCAKITDGTHQTPKYFDSGVIFLSSKNVTSGVIDWDNIKYIDEKQHLEMHKRVAPRVGDILLAKNGTTGVAAMVDRDVIFDIYVSLAHIRVLDEVTPEYMLYFINSPLAKTQFNKRLKGSGVPNLHLEEIREVKIPFPKSLPEQQRIVSILDECFAAIDKAKANAEQNLKNAKELFESYLQGVFKKKGDGWVDKNLGEVSNIQRGSSPRPKGDPKYFSKTKTEFNWITISDISSYCENNVLLKTREWLTETGSKRSRYVEKNEFIIAVSGSTTGKCCITGIKGFIYDGLAVVKVKKNMLDPIYLLNYMMSLYSTINNSKSGAAFPNINTNFLNNLPISLPPLQQQLTIVRQLDALQAETQKLEAIYQQKLADLDELKKSVLQKAFSGELTGREVEV